MDPFSLLTAGISFDKKKFEKSVKVFEKPKKDDEDDEEEEGLGAPSAPLPDLASVSDPVQAAHLLRKAYRIRVKGDGGCPPPLQSFEELPELHEPGMRDALLEALREDGVTEPSPIQRQAIPAIMSGREVFAIAPTGSGKTLAFLLPIMLGIRKALDDPVKKPLLGGVKAVVLSPTRELAGQLHRVASLVAKPLHLRATLVTNAALASGGDLNRSDLLVATPERLALMNKGKKVDLSKGMFLVLDEADRLLAGAFLEQVDAVIAALGSEHTERASREAAAAPGPSKPSKKSKKPQAAAPTPPSPSIPVLRLLFSATLPDTVEDLARTVLHQPLRITVGLRNSATASVVQRLIYVGKEEGKIMTLRQMLKEGALTPPVMVFVDSKDRAKALHRELLYDGIHVDSIHAGQPQVARNAAVENFRTGRTWVLIATDLVGRGMDFLAVNTVVNFDFPVSTTDYIHRVGRTGRGGRKGEAVTLVTEGDKGRVRPVAHLIRDAGGEVPDWMLKLKKERKERKRKSKTARGEALELGEGESEEEGEGAGGTEGEEGRPAAKRARGGKGPEGLPVPDFVTRKLLAKAKAQLAKSTAADVAQAIAAAGARRPGGAGGVRGKRSGGKGDKA